MNHVMSIMDPIINKILKRLPLEIGKQKKKNSDKKIFANPSPIYNVIP